MDIDGPVRPIDREADAQRVERAHAARRRSDVRMLFTLAQPLAALAGGLVLGGWHADAPVIGAVGMVLAWGCAHAVLYVAALVAGVLALPGLLARLAGRPVVARRRPVFARAARAVFAVHALVFAGLAALVGTIAGLAGDGALHRVDIVAFALFGLALGASSVLTEPG